VTVRADISLPDPAPASRALYERALRVMPGGNTRTTVFHPPHPLYASRGQGCRIIDADGVERIDFLNNYTALLHGHARPHVVAAASEQLARGTCFSMPTEAEIELAEEICRRLEGVEQVHFAGSGSEAVAQAVTGCPLTFPPALQVRGFFLALRKLRGRAGGVVTARPRGTPSPQLLGPSPDTCAGC
jgi:4-aminobutyrate aminotransferase-like enzyme